MCGAVSPRRLAQHGVTAEIRFVEGESLHGAAKRALTQAKRGEIDAVVVGGGDGSIRTVAGVLAETSSAARRAAPRHAQSFRQGSRYPLAARGGGRDDRRRDVRIVDLADVNGETFINNSSIGIYPYMVIDRERRRARHKLAKWMAMVPAFFRMLRHFPRRRLRIVAKGFARPYRTPCLFVGNNEYGMELFTFGKRDRLDTGKLWFYVVKPRNPAEFF